MGRCASATVAFGVDLGNPEYGEWNFELTDGVYLEPPEWDDLLAEFAGWDEVELPYSRERGSPEDAAWSKQRARRRAAMTEAGVSQGHYGYEYAGQYLSVGGSGQTVDYGCEPLESMGGRLATPPWFDVYRLECFIEFLDTKGLVLKGEYRQPRWLLMASYG